MSWLGWAVLSAVFAACTAILAKLGLAGANADAVTWARTAVILLWMSLVLSAAGQWGAVLQLDARQWRLVVLSGLAAGASWMCYFRALQAGTVTQVSLVDRSSLALVILLSVLVLSERPHPREWLGLGLVLLGVGLVATAR